MARAAPSWLEVDVRDTSGDFAGLKAHADNSATSNSSSDETTGIGKLDRKKCFEI
jgi:hypothetical protein